jgi:hypothetical protein
VIPARISATFSGWNRNRECELFSLSTLVAAWDLASWARRR